MTLACLEDMYRTMFFKDKKRQCAGHKLTLARTIIKVLKTTPPPGG